MTWKDRINEALGAHQEGQLCLACLSSLIPEIAPPEIRRALGAMRSAPYHVSTYEARCSRCGEVRETFACG